MLALLVPGVGMGGSGPSAITSLVIEACEITAPWIDQCQTTTPWIETADATTPWVDQAQSP